MVWENILSVVCLVLVWSAATNLLVGGNVHVRFEEVTPKVNMPEFVLDDMREMEMAQHPRVVALR
jgi:hypothetical protein